jgi:hypothetical protein
MKRKYGFFLGFAVLLIAAIFTMAGCDNGNGGDSVGGGSVKLTITGLSQGTTYFITPYKNWLSLNTSYAKSAAADSSGIVSVSYSYSDLKLHGFTGNCYIEYLSADSTVDKTSKNTYQMVEGADYTLNANTDFD